MRRAKSLQLSASTCVLPLDDDASVGKELSDSNRVDAFATFMRAYQDMVYSTAVRLTGNEAQAEDIAQDVFLKAFERFDELRESPTTPGWLKTVTTNMTLNYLSRYRRRWRFFSELRRQSDAESESEPEVEFAVPDTLLACVGAGERSKLVETALRGLPEHQRVPLVLYHFEDMAYEDIAARLQISLAKVKTDIFRARAALAKALTRQGISGADVEA
jgi:RNA polymerase sigma-70 factor (ECF subfamily)